MKFCTFSIRYGKRLSHGCPKINKYLVITSFVKIEAMKTILCLGAWMNFFLVCCPIRMKFSISFHFMYFANSKGLQSVTTNGYRTSHLDIYISRRNLHMVLLSFVKIRVGKDVLFLQA